MFIRYVTCGVMPVLFGVSLAYAAGGDPVNGKKLYEWNCSVCHGESGKGDGPIGAALLSPPTDFKNPQSAAKSDIELFKVIRDGRAVMPGWKHQLTEQEMWDLLVYLRSLSK